MKAALAFFRLFLFLGRGDLNFRFRQDLGLELEHAQEQNRVSIFAGRSRFALQSLPPEDFPDLAAGDMTHKFTLSAADVKKLRDLTGAGMMDCKKALTEANGDFEAAIDLLRKKGQKIAANRQDREAKEGYVFGKVTADNKHGVIVAICCETDFVAKNADFVKFGESILDVAMSKMPATKDELNALALGSTTVAEACVEQMGKIGEKIEVID